MNRRKQFYLETYGKSLTQFAKAINCQIKVQKESGEIITLEKDIYICPMCMSNFFYLLNGKYFESETFSNDHYPPESVGGNQTILVCKPCNDFFGRKMDYALKEYLQALAFLRKEEGSSYPLMISYGSIRGQYNISTGWQAGKMVQNVSFKKYPLVKDWMLDTKKEEWGMKMKFLMPAQELINKALLRAAYMYCFANWGYDFAYSPTASHIRDVLWGRKSHPLFNFGVFGDIASTTLENGFYFISNPKRFQAFQIMFDIKLLRPEISQKVFVIIPIGTEEGWQELKNFTSWIEKKEADTKVIKLYNDCVIRGFYTHYSYTWHQLTSK